MYEVRKIDLVVGTLIIIYAADDHINKSIHPGLMLYGAAEIIVCLLVKGGASPEGVIIGALPGAVLLLISFMTDQAVGRADAEVLIMLGIVYGAGQAVTMLLIACFIFAVICRDRKRAAFIPSLLAAFIIERVLTV